MYAGMHQLGAPAAALGLRPRPPPTLEELATLREALATLQLENTRLVAALDQLKTLPGRSDFPAALEDRAVLSCLAEALKDANSSTKSFLNPPEFELARLDELCKNQRRVISGLLQKQQGVFSSTAISQLWKIVELLGLQLRRASQQGQVSLENAALSKELKALTEILHLLSSNKPATHTASAQTHSQPSGTALVHRSSSPPPRPLGCDAGVGTNPSVALQQVTAPHASLAAPRRFDSATEALRAPQGEAGSQTAAPRVVDHTAQTEKRACEVCGVRAEKTRRFGVSSGPVHLANFGTSEELLEARRALFAAKNGAKKLEDERNRLALDVEDKKHKISVISRRVKTLEEDLKADVSKSRDKENVFKEEVEKLKKTVAELKHKLKKQPSRDSRPGTPHFSSVTRRSLDRSDLFVRESELRNSVSVEISPPRPPPRRELVGEPSWRRILGHFSEPEIATIRKSVEFIGLEGVTQVMSGLLD